MFFEPQTATNGITMPRSVSCLGLCINRCLCSEKICEKTTSHWSGKESFGSYTVYCSNMPLRSSIISTVDAQQFIKAIVPFLPFSKIICVSHKKDKLKKNNNKNNNKKQLNFDDYSWHGGLGPNQQPKTSYWWRNLEILITAKQKELSTTYCFCHANEVPSKIHSAEQ